MQSILLVVISEFIVDWIKHAFITKFNKFDAEVYSSFKVTLVSEVTQSVESDVSLYFKNNFFLSF